MEAERKACLLLIDASLRELTQEVHMGKGTHRRVPSELITQGAAVLPGSDRARREAFGYCPERRGELSWPRRS